MYYLFRFGYKKGESEYQYLCAYTRKSDVIKEQIKMRNCGLLSWYLDSKNNHCYNCKREIYMFNELSIQIMRNMAIISEMKNIIEEF